MDSDPLVADSLDSSTITTASAPAGSGAPVMMRIASPLRSTRSVDTPAATSSTTSTQTGTAATSTACTA